MMTPNVRQFLRMRMIPPQTMLTKRMPISNAAPGKGILIGPTSSKRTIESKYFRCTSSRPMLDLSDGAQPGEEGGTRGQPPPRPNEAMNAKSPRRHERASGFGGVRGRSWDRWSHRATPRTFGWDNPV